jgi:hypothetical protein
MADDDDDVDLYADLGGTGAIDDNVSRANLPHSRMRQLVPGQRHSFFRVQTCTASVHSFITTLSEMPRPVPTTHWPTPRAATGGR